MSYIPECPYCKRDVDFEDLPLLDDDSHEITCYCGKKFRMAASVDYLIDTNCEWNNEQHKWEKIFDDSKTEFCDNCDEIRGVK